MGRSYLFVSRKRKTENERERATNYLIHTSSVTRWDDDAPCYAHYYERTQQSALSNPASKQANKPARENPGARTTKTRTICNDTTTKRGWMGDDDQSISTSNHGKTTSCSSQCSLSSTFVSSFGSIATQTGCASGVVGVIGVGVDVVVVDAVGTLW
mmetsp:Transcript_15979/g.31245  ORF Transcript_15979/g.31245 Transcript_15979/m.31245 type:complete len:156 (+) Transcript_15979:594-1061(+)